MRDSLVGFKWKMINGTNEVWEVPCIAFLKLCIAKAYFGLVHSSCWLLLCFFSDDIVT